MGTTSACAENTTIWGCDIGHNGNYLRVRGEYTSQKGWCLIKGELPPRARRIPLLDIPRQKWYGTTSACAENTRDWGYFFSHHGNYLRVRGEYRMAPSAAGLAVELPPRARRIRPGADFTTASLGTTSACAENTATAANLGLTGRNYLRVRGEYAALKHSYAELAELPPRARRIHFRRRYLDRGRGTTSACAENTPAASLNRLPGRNYLRVRGEYPIPGLPGSHIVELPPRARRIPPLKNT